MIGIVVWFAASLDLSRLLGHHAKIGHEAGEALKSYEIKTYYYANLPGFLLALSTGLYMLFSNLSLYLDPKGAWGATFHIKLTIVTLAIILDQVVLWKMRKLHRGHSVSRGTFMALHGILGMILMVVIVLILARPLV